VFKRRRLSIETLVTWTRRASAALFKSRQCSDISDDTDPTKAAAGPKNAHRLVDGASSTDCLTLTRLWLSDELPRNSESRVNGVVIRALKRNTSVKFLLSYADPAQRHLGTIYQATGWLYTGLSQATPMYDIGDGVPRHSGGLAHSLPGSTLR